MRIRKPFAAAFVILLLIAASLGLAPNQLPQYKQSDKVLHFVTFLLITLCFYWILDTNRRRVINLTLIVCTAGLSAGSEVVQGLLPNGREFDPYDILANVVGSGIALFVCSWYHKRMLERRRAARSYHVVPGEEHEQDEDRDIELGSVGRQESGIIPASAAPNVTEELDNWDENADDWDEDEPSQRLEGDAQQTATSAADDGTSDNKRSS